MTTATGGGPGRQSTGWTPGRPYDFDAEITANPQCWRVLGLERDGRLTGEVIIRPPITACHTNVLVGHIADPIPDGVPARVRLAVSALAARWRREAAA